MNQSKGNKIMKKIKERLELSKTIKYRMNNVSSSSEGIRKELDIPKFMNVTDFKQNDEIVRRDTSDFKIPSFLSSNPGVIKRIVDEPPMTQGYANKLTERVKAMTTGEKIVVAEALPVDICIDRIRTENERQQKFAEAIRKSFSILGVDSI